MESNLGQIVCSRAGHDKGKHFIIVREIDECYVLIADGKSRPIERPKKKKKKHLDYSGSVSENVRKKLLENENITNSELHRILRAFSMNVDSKQGK